MFEIEKQVAKDARRLALDMVHNAQSAHIGSCLSIIDIAVQLFSKSTKSENAGDLVLISKGHAAAGVYAVLKCLDVIPAEWTSSYCQNGSQLGGHVTSTHIPILELSTGSLGHALPYAIGRALGKSRLRQSGHVYVVISDGECNEGSNWEAALLAPFLKLNNLTVVIDRNRLQSLGKTEETVPLEPLSDKWLAFNWEVQTIDGHDFNELSRLTDHKSQTNARVFIANTIKGKGVTFMENSVLWHYRPPNLEELELAQKEVS